MTIKDGSGKNWRVEKSITLYDTETGDTKLTLDDVVPINEISKVVGEPPEIITGCSKNSEGNNHVIARWDKKRKEVYFECSDGHIKYIKDLLCDFSDDGAVKADIGAANFKIASTDKEDAMRIQAAIFSRCLRDVHKKYIPNTNESEVKANGSNSTN